MGVENSAMISVNIYIYRREMTPVVIFSFFSLSFVGALLARGAVKYVICARVVTVAGGVMAEE